MVMPHEHESQSLRFRKLSTIEPKAGPRNTEGDFNKLRHTAPSRLQRRDLFNKKDMSDLTRRMSQLSVMEKGRGVSWGTILIRHITNTDSDSRQLPRLGSGKGATSTFPIEQNGYMGRKLGDQGASILRFGNVVSRYSEDNLSGSLVVKSARLNTRLPKNSSAKKRGISSCSPHRNLKRKRAAPS